MSFAHWWIAIRLDEDACNLIEPHFAAASEKALLSDESRQAVEAWHRAPSLSEQATNAFIWAFNLPGFDKLAEQFLMKDGTLTDVFDETRLLNMTITTRYTPVSILWHALGYDSAIRLPGQMGNMLLHPGQVVDAQEKTRLAYAATTPDALIRAARHYCDHSLDDNALRDVIDFLPDSLARARERRHGLLTLARAQI